MKKVLVSIVTLVSIVGIVSLTSCNKEEAGNGQFTATMESCTSQDGKTVLSGTNLNWVSGDQIAIYGIGGSGTYSATPQTPATTAAFTRVSGSDVTVPCRAYYPATLTTDGINVTFPATQTYVEGSMLEFPMYAESNTNTLAFRNLCGALKLHLTKANTSITSIAVTASSPINGTFTLNYNNGDPVLTPLGGSATTAPVPSTTVLTCATAQAIDNGADFFIYLPAGNYTGLEIEMTAANNATCTKTASVTIPVVRSQYTTISLGENDLTFNSLVPQGALSGLFSVSATQQVRFSQGNLQYQASTDTWRFALQQYDIIGCANSNISPTYAGWIDLFGWGTGNNPTLSSTDHADYSTFVDWGVNAISNGGGIVNTWRTLTAYEWSYLLNSRSNNTNLGIADARYAKGCVNNTYGVILFPDGYVHPASVVVPIGINQQNAATGWNGNVYTLSQWSLMEAAGAVFLPAAGNRLGTSGVGNFYGGFYWSSSTFEYSGVAYVGHINFQNNSLMVGYSISFRVGFSVRLVQDND